MKLTTEQKIEVIEKDKEGFKLGRYGGMCCHIDNALICLGYYERAGDNYDTIPLLIPEFMIHKPKQAIAELHWFGGVTSYRRRITYFNKLLKTLKAKL